MWRRPWWQRVIITSANRILPIRILILIKFLKHVGYWPSITLPRSYNEKIQYRKLHDKNPLIVTCSDKFAVRAYVAEKIGDRYLVPLLYSGTSITEDELRQTTGDFVVKTTHDSGTVLFVRESQAPNFAHIVRRIEFALSVDFGLLNQEPWYSKITPRVIIEPMLVGENGEEVRDYKLHVFRQDSGQTIILQVDYDRQSRHTQTFYDEEFNILPISLRYPNEFRPIDHIPNFDDMLRISRILAADFDYVRVDLYNVDGKIYFGELTFAHESGFGRFTDKAADYDMGAMWQLDVKKATG